MRWVVDLGSWVVFSILPFFLAITNLGVRRQLPSVRRQALFKTASDQILIGSTDRGKIFGRDEKPRPVVVCFILGFGNQCRLYCCATCALCCIVMPCRAITVTHDASTPLCNQLVGYLHIADVNSCTIRFSLTVALHTFAP